MKRAISLVTLIGALAVLYLAVGYFGRGYTQSETKDASQRLAVEISYAGPFDVKSMSVVLDPKAAELAETDRLAAKDHYLLTGSLTNVSSHNIPVVSLFLKVFKPGGEIRGGASWVYKVGLGPNETGRLSLPFIVSIEQGDRLVLEVDVASAPKAKA